MERALSADLERVSSSMSNGEADHLNIQLLSNDSSLGDAHIRVPAEGQITRDAIEAATGRSALTVRQCALLQDFPPDHPFQGTKTSSFRQVGNAVPPALARVAARAIMQANGG